MEVVTRQRIVGPVLSWESQASQYPLRGEPGLSYFAGDVSEHYPGSPPIDCLLVRERRAGALVGILNHYPVDYLPWERAGNVNLWVKRQYQRQGIGALLLAECERRWGPVNLEQQRYTPEGEALADWWAARRDLPLS